MKQLILQILSLVPNFSFLGQTFSFSWFQLKSPPYQGRAFILLPLICFISCLNSTAQVHNWAGFVTTTNSAARNFTNGNMTAVVTAVTGGGTTGYSNGSISRIGGGGLCAGTPTGLFLEMSGASITWANRITVAITFTCPVVRPATFSIYEINFDIWNDGAVNWALFFDQMTISATDELGVAIPPANITVGGCAGAGNQFTVGSTKIIRAGVSPSDACECANATVSIGPAGQQIKTITIIYNNYNLSPLPPQIAGKYGICQYQYTIVSPVTVASTIACLLPMKLQSFTGICNNNTRQFSWFTATEINNDYFSIEKSSDGINFTEFERIDGVGNSTSVQNYTAEFESIDTDMNYYRLKQTDFDGTPSYSDIIFVSCQEADGDIQIYPNPTVKNITIEAPSKSRIEILNTQGQLILQQTLQQEITTIDLSELAKGLYILKLYNDNYTKVIKVAKE